MVKQILIVGLFFCYCCLSDLAPSLLACEKEDPSKVIIYKNLPFSNSEQQLTLDLFLPDSPGQPVPCIVVIQGGGFMSQDGQRFRFFAEYIAKQGFASALISYRGRPDHEYQTTIADTKDAVRYIHSLSHQYNIDASKIGAMGRSAGATLAVLLAVTGDNNQLDVKDRHSEGSVKIQAAVGFAGVYDFVSRFSDSLQMSLQPRLETKMISNGEWIGAPYGLHNSDWIKASAISHVTKEDPPILFFHCKNDSTVPWIQSKLMYERMIGIGVKSEIIYYDTGGHGFKIGDQEIYLEKMMRYFRKRFQHEK